MAANTPLPTFRGHNLQLPLPFVCLSPHAKRFTLHTSQKSDIGRLKLIIASIRMGTVLSTTSKMDPGVLKNVSFASPDFVDKSFSFCDSTLIKPCIQVANRSNHFAH